MLPGISPNQVSHVWYDVTVLQSQSGLVAILNSYISCAKLIMIDHRYISSEMEPLYTKIFKVSHARNCPFTNVR